MRPRGDRGVLQSGNGQEEAAGRRGVELFCQYYARSGEFFGNGTLAYAEAYGYELEKLSQLADDLPTSEEELEYQPHGGALRRRHKDETIVNSPYSRAYNVC